jgi:hypothetical protein
MSQSKKVRALGVLGAWVAASVLAMGCSAAAPDEGGTAPAVNDPGVSPEMAVPQPTYYSAGNLIPKVCVTGVLGASVNTLPANFVIKKPNNWGLNYGYTDNYTIPFPTPWVETAPESTYEGNLYSWIPSTPRWEYLVYDVSNVTPTATWLAPDLYVHYPGHAYFMVPIPSLNDYSAAASLASQYTAPPTEARVNKCVRVLTASGSQLFDNNEFYLVYDEHDPISPPGKCGGGACSS